MAIETVDLPIKGGNFPYQTVCLPECNVGKTTIIKPSPSHHHKIYRRYVYHSRSWVVYCCVTHIKKSSPTKTQVE